MSLQTNQSLTTQVRHSFCYLTIIAIFISFIDHSLSKPINVSETENNDSFLGMYTMLSGENPRFTPNGQRIVEGDIVLPQINSSTNEDNIISNHPDTDSYLSSRKAISEVELFWPNGEVVYTYHESIKPSERVVIEAAMQHWQTHTCVSFRPRTGMDMYFIRFRSDTQGCWSLVGRQPDRASVGQDVSIGLGCANLNVVVHEIGHVLGFYHEQSRSDRDSYINIVWENVQEGYGPQFRLERDENYNIPYDLLSTMQYPQWAFSKQLFEKNTIVALNPAYQRFLNRNNPLSFRDRQLANTIYRCTSACANTTIESPSVCNNGGYPTIRTVSGQNSCLCDCPPSHSGFRCENTLRNDYYETLPCGGKVDSAGIIETPGYPQRTGPHQSCMWDITSPQANKVVKIKFEGFEFAPRFTKAGTKVINKCFNETVEIRIKNSNIHDGDFYCGTDIQPGTVLTADGPRATIIIIANDKMIGSGLRAKVSFVDPITGLGDEDEDNKQVTGSTTSLPPISIENERTTQSIFVTPSTIFPPNPFTSFTFPPIMTSRPIIATIAPLPSSTSLPLIPSVPTSNIWEEYEKQSKMTMRPLIPGTISQVSTIA